MSTRRLGSTSSCHAILCCFPPTLILKITRLKSMKGSSNSPSSPLSYSVELIRLIRPNGRSGSPPSNAVHDPSLIDSLRSINCYLTAKNERHSVKPSIIIWKRPWMKIASILTDFKQIVIHYLLENAVETKWIWRCMLFVLTRWRLAALEGHQRSHASLLDTTARSVLMVNKRKALQTRDIEGYVSPTMSRLCSLPRIDFPRRRYDDGHNDRRPASSSSRAYLFEHHQLERSSYKSNVFRA